MQNAQSPRSYSEQDRVATHLGVNLSFDGDDIRGCLSVGIMRSAYTEYKTL